MKITLTQRMISQETITWPGFALKYFIQFFRTLTGSGCLDKYIKGYLKSKTHFSNSNIDNANTIATKNEKYVAKTGLNGLISKYNNDDDASMNNIARIEIRYMITLRIIIL